MTMFIPLRNPKTRFYLKGELHSNFYKLKGAKVSAIIKGIQIFDLGKPTCIQPDWCTTGIGYFFIAEPLLL